MPDKFTLSPDEFLAYVKTPMTVEEWAVVERHKNLTKSNNRDEKMIEYEKDGYIVVGVALLMCICNVCQKAAGKEKPCQ